MVGGDGEGRRHGAASPQAAGIFDMSGEVAFVTGASSGLGRRFAIVLAANGAKVALAGRRRDELDATAAEIAALGGTALVVPFEVTDHAAIAPAFDAIARDLGPLTCFVNNAGIAGGGPIEDLAIARWREILAVDLEAPFLLAQEAARRMAGRGGSIVNVSSILGLRPTAGDAAYAVAKAGLAQLTGVMALEFAAAGVRVNTLAPGYVVTGMNRAFFESDESRRITDRIPLRRVGQVDDLDGAILFLASRASRFVTGTVVVVDGGHLLSL
jgi:3-oxoacyl-[acyl-carrier protein] reductase